MELTERRILITGGGSGIGLALARALAPANRVVIAGRDLARLESAAVPGVETVPLDVTSEEDAGAAVAWVEEHLGGLDLLVNSAGVFRGGPLELSARSGAGGDASLLTIAGRCDRGPVVSRAVAVRGRLPGPSRCVATGSTRVRS